MSRFIQYDAQVQSDAPIIDTANRNPVVELVRAALFIGVFTVLGMAAIGIVLFASIGQLKGHFGDVIFIASVGGVILSAFFGVTWIVHYVSPPRVEKAKGEQGTLPIAISEGERLDLIGRKIIEMHHLDGMDATRIECEKVNIVQGDWNLINGAFKAIGLKSERGWREGDFNGAVTAWRGCIRIYPDGTFFYRPSISDNTWTRLG